MSIFSRGGVVDVAKHEAPLIVDTAGTTKDGLYSMDADEHSMLLDVACGRGGLGVEPAPKSRRTDKNGRDPVSGADGDGDARGEYEGCRDAESLTPLHQVLPYGSQFHDTMSSAGHAWVNADIRDDEQAKHAVAQVRGSGTPAHGSAATDTQRLLGRVGNGQRRRGLSSDCHRSSWR